MTLGPEEEGLPLGSFGLKHLPDGHLSFRWVGNELFVWVAAGVATYLFRGPSWDRLTLDRPGPVFGPSGSGFDASYAAPGSVVEGPKSGQPLLFYHAETCQRDNFTATIGVAHSLDNGRTWERLGPALAGDRLALACSRITGAGQPSVALIGGYYYLYYVQWLAYGPADQIYLARAPQSSRGVAGSWEKLGSVVQPPDPIDRTHYAALPGVSWNRSLGLYLLTFEADDGFYLTSSADGIVWDRAQRLLDFPQPQSVRRRGDLWFSYPTLLSLDEASDATTNAAGYLVYSRGIWGGEPHRMVRRPFGVQLA